MGQTRAQTNILLKTNQNKTKQPTGRQRGVELNLFPQPLHAERGAKCGFSLGTNYPPGILSQLFGFFAAPNLSLLCQETLF